ncbi:MAG: hypothetical protein H0X50_12175, partial [Nitrosopumilus sp.]|nr:hypothetical protein [Nitrosopumilus sp.]
MTYNYMTVRMKVEIINKVIYPAVAYRLIIAPVDMEFIRRIEQYVTNVIYRKLNLNPIRNSIKHIQAPAYLLGYGLVDLKTLYMRVVVGTWIETGLNGIDETTRLTCEEAMKTNTRLAQSVRKFAKELGIEIINTPSISLRHSTLQVLNYETSNMLSKFGIHTLNQLFYFDKNEKIIKLREIRNIEVTENIANFPVSGRKFVILKERIEKHMRTSNLSEKIHENLQKERKRITWGENIVRKDEYALIYIDAALVSNQVGVGISWCEARGSTIVWTKLRIKPRGARKVDEGDLIGVIVILQETPLKEKIAIVSDNEQMVKVTKEIIDSVHLKIPIEDTQLWRRKELKILITTIHKLISSRNSNTVEIFHISRNAYKYQKCEEKSLPENMKKYLKEWKITKQLFNSIGQGNRFAHKSARRAVNVDSEIIDLNYYQAGKYNAWSVINKAIIINNIKTYLSISSKEKWEQNYLKNKPKLNNAGEQKVFAKIMSSNDPMLAPLQNFIWKAHHQKLLTESYTTRINASLGKKRQMISPSGVRSRLKVRDKLTGGQGVILCFHSVVPDTSWGTSRTNTNPNCILCNKEENLETHIHWRTCPENKHEEDLDKQIKDIIMFYFYLTKETIEQKIRSTVPQLEIAPYLIYNMQLKIKNKLTKIPENIPHRDEISMNWCSNTQKPTDIANRQKSEELQIWEDWQKIIREYNFRGMGEVGECPPGLRIALRGLGLRRE